MKHHVSQGWAFVFQNGHAKVSQTNPVTEKFHHRRMPAYLHFSSRSRLAPKNILNKTKQRRTGEVWGVSQECAVLKYSAFSPGHTMGCTYECIPWKWLSL